MLLEFLTHRLRIITAVPAVTKTQTNAVTNTAMVIDTGRKD